MKLIFLLCLMMSACVRPPAPPEPVPDPLPVLQELAPLDAMHDRFLSFREDDLFLRYGFTFNSPYAGWLQQVLEFEKNPSMAESARLLAGLAVSARIHGTRSEVYRQFEMRFDQSLRAPLEQDPAEQVAVIEASGETNSTESGSAEEAMDRAPAPAGTPAQASGVSILFSGDTQGVVFAQSGPFGSVGGLARRTSTISHFRTEDPGLVLLDAGDAFAYGFERAERINRVLVRAMNHLRYDAMGLGGIDLAMGEVALRELVAMAKFPLICSNLEFQPGVAPWIKPYVIFERNGRRIAVLSVLPESSGTVITGARFVDAGKALGVLLPELRDTVDLVVLMTQLGSAEVVGLLGDNAAVDVILGDHRAGSGAIPTYVPAVPKGLGFALLRLHMPESGAAARVESMPVLLGSDLDAQLLQIVDDLE